MWFSRKSSRSTEKAKFSALLTGVMSAVQKASSTAGQQNLYILDQYFKKDADGKLQPLYVRIEVAPGKVMDVPLITLMNPASYKLDELEMQLSIRLSLDSIKKATHDQLTNSSIRRASYSVEMCPRDSGGKRRPSDLVDVKVKFKASDPSEGLMRILEDLSNSITTVSEGQAPDRKHLVTGTTEQATDVFDHVDMAPDADTEVSEVVDADPDA